MNRLVPVRVNTRFIGFDGLEDHNFQEGMSLEEMARAVPSLPEMFWAGDGVIRMDGQTMPREWWRYIRPKVSDEGKQLSVITFHVVPRGSGRTAGILTTIAGVALIAAGVYFQQGWLINIGIGVTLSGVGMLLAPPPPQQKQGEEARAIQAGISGNPPAPFEWLTRVLGRMVYSPPYLIRPYTIYSRNSITVGGAVGLVGRHAVTGVRINGALADSMSNLTYQVKTGASGDTALTVGSKWIWEESPRIRLSNFDLKTDSSQRDNLYDQTTPANSYPQYQTFLTRSGEYADKVVIRFLFPQGMSADTDTNVASAIPIRVEFRRRGSSTWILGPEFHFYDENKGKADLRQNLTFLWEADTVGRLASVNNDRIAYVAYRQGFSTVIADAYFSNGSSRYAYHVGRDEDGYTVYLNPTTFPKDHYEFRIKRGLAYRQGLFSSSAYTYNGSTPALFFEHYVSSGVARVRVSEEFKIRAEAQIEAFQTWSNEYPLQDALNGGVPLTLIGFEGRDMEINSVSATFESQVAIWSGGNWNTVTTSRNPAAHYRHVLLDSLNADPRAAEIVNSGVLEDWYTYCVTKGYECNALASANEPDILAMIASAGWAGMRSHEKWEVILERDTSSFNVTQLFTPLNSSGYVASKAFADLPHALNVEYADEDDDNNLKTLIVYAPGYAASNATRFETIRMDGITDANKVADRAINLLRVLYYRQTERRIDVGVEALVSQRGDIVGLGHDLKDEHIWFGTINRVITSGSNVTGVVLNGEALLSLASPPFGAAIRYMSGQIVLKPIIASGDSDTLMFTTPFAIPANDVLRKGCLVTVGVLNEEARRCRVSNIRYKDEFTATISLVDEAPEIYTGILSARGLAEGEAAVDGTGSSTATLTAVGEAAGLSEALGVGDYLGSSPAVGAASGIGTASAVGEASGTASAVGSASGSSVAEAVGYAEGIAQTVGAAPGSGFAAGVGTTIDTWGAGSASATGTATGVSEESVPSTTFVYKTTLTDTTNKASGETYTFAGADIGTAHAKRVVILGVVSSNSGTTVTVGGVSATLVDSAGSMRLFRASVPSGATADIVVNPAATIGRMAVSYGVFYPSSATPLGADGGTASGTGNVAHSINASVQEIGGIIVAYGGHQASLGTFTWTWGGADAITEHVDAQIESASSYSMASVNLTEDATNTLTMAYTASATKAMVYGTWGASA